MTRYNYVLVDVFTDRQFGGNPLAVFTDSADLSDAQMQRFATELNLSESAFVFPATDEHHTCRVRFFTPKRELLMAGHPTIGSAFVLATEGIIPRNGKVIFEEGVGPVTLTLQEDSYGLRVEMEQPIPEFRNTYSERRAEIARMLSLELDDLLDGIPPQVLSAGVPYLYVPITGLNAIKKVKLRQDLWHDFWGKAEPVDIYVFTMETVDTGATAHSRMFAPTMKIVEDPATGAASGPLGAYLWKYGMVSRESAKHMVNEQGFEMGRPSLIYVHIEISGNGAITRSAISGYTQPVGGGYIDLLMQCSSP